MPRMRKIWRVYSGTDGQSHIAEMPLVMKPFVDTEGAHGEATAMQSAEGIAFRVSPPGYVLDWHCAPRRQYSISAWPDSVIEYRSEEHTSDLQSRGHIVWRLLFEKKKNI